MFTFNNKQFEETNTKETSYVPEYQVTRVADNAYQVYSHIDKTANIYDQNGTLKALASIRGGRKVTASVAAAISNLDTFSSIVITEDALKLSKSASAENSKEPWKLVVVGGVEYFVKSDAEVESEELEKEAESKAKLKKTAAPVSNKYTIRIEAHNVSEIGKIAGFAEEAFGAVPSSFEIPGNEQNVIVFDTNTPNTPHQEHECIMEGLGKNNIHLPDGGVSVVDETGGICNGPECCTCPCCGHHMQKCVTEAPECVVEEACCMPQPVCGEFTLVTSECPKVSHASKIETLQKYADAHYSNYKIFNKVGELVDNVTRTATAFKDELSDFLWHSFASSHPELKLTAAEGKVIDQYGNTKEQGDPVEVNDTVISEDGSVVKVKSKEDNENEIEKTAETIAAEPEPVRDPNEKNPNDTKAGGDDNVKRWKGMREDPTSGKFIVYITESEEHIFDNADDAIDFLVRK